MLEDKNILALIPARGGSKGVPRKNIRELAGKPLIAWTIEEAHKSKYIDYLIVSSEDQEIINVSKKWGADVPFVRPQELAKDRTPGIEVVLHAAKECPEYSHVLLLQPTSPLRTVEHIDSFIDQFQDDNLKCSVSVTTPDKHPMWMFSMDADKILQPFFQGPIPTNRQELPSAYAVNGALYMAHIPWLQEQKSFLTSETKGFYMYPEVSIDIDTEMDFLFCDFLLRNNFV